VFGVGSWDKDDAIDNDPNEQRATYVSDKATCDLRRRGDGSLGRNS